MVKSLLISIKGNELAGFKMLCLMLFHYHSGMNSRVELNRAMCIIIVVIILNAHWNLSDTKRPNLAVVCLNSLETNFPGEYQVN